MEVDDHIDPLPLYNAQDTSSSQTPVDPSAGGQGSSADNNLPSNHIDRVDAQSSTKAEASYDVLQIEQLNASRLAQDTRVRTFFDAIYKKKNSEVLSQLGEAEITANTQFKGTTPLLAAVSTRNVELVQQLIEAGAEPDAFGLQPMDLDVDPDPSFNVRTPLQLAASLGHLRLVKMLMEEYRCNDALVAPDGQIALRLAADNGHREVVEYLPARRAGGFLRWQKHHEKAIRRMKAALSKIASFLKFFVWDIEKFFLWTVPKHVVVRPVAKISKKCWNDRHLFGPWCKRQVQQIGRRTAKFLKAIPKAATKSGNAVWKFGTVTLPKCAKHIAKWLWKMLTKGIPAAIKACSKWIWGILSIVGTSIWNVTKKTASLIHTAFDAMVTFFRNTTLRDIWNGICAVLRAIFLDLPKKIWSWLCTFGDISWDVLKAMFGSIGKCIWLICIAIAWVIVFIPRKLWEVLASLASSFVKGWHEVIVLIRPKA